MSRSTDWRKSDDLEKCGREVTRFGLMMALLMWRADLVSGGRLSVLESVERVMAEPEPVSARLRFGSAGSFSSREVLSDPLLLKLETRGFGVLEAVGDGPVRDADFERGLIDWSTVYSLYLGLVVISILKWQPFGCCAGDI